MSKTILITGANRGIGYEIARQCGMMGHHIILSGRNASKTSVAVQKLKENGIHADLLLMDVSVKDSIRIAAEEFSESGIKLDVLVNNAGTSIRADRNLLKDEETILEKILNTNSFGPLYVTKAFLPYMNRPGRIIMISSSGGILNGPVPGWSPAYCTSKTLLNAFTKHLAYELEGEHISVNAVCPGWVKTDMGGSGATRSVEKGAETPVWLAFEAPQSLTCKFLRDKKEIVW
jgi:NAD(P)-dependent dehydrogenase (short-subunit alcohol dehydrogenase family)